MSLSDSIKIIRQKELMNQEEFAAALNVSLASVNRWEVGKSIPNLIAMKAMKAFCDSHSRNYEMIEKEWLTARVEAKKEKEEILNPMDLIQRYEEQRASLNAEIDNVLAEITKQLGGNTND